MEKGRRKEKGEWGGEEEGKRVQKVRDIGKGMNVEKAKGE